MQSFQFPFTFFIWILWSNLNKYYSICMYRVSYPLQSPFGKRICRTLRSIGSIKITLKFDIRTKRRKRKNCVGNKTWCAGLNNWHHFGYVDYADCYSFSFQWLTERLTHRHHQISLNICKWLFSFIKRFINFKS